MGNHNLIPHRRQSVSLSVPQSALEPEFPEQQTASGAEKKEVHKAPGKWNHRQQEGNLWQLETT